MAGYGSRLGLLVWLGLSCTAAPAVTLSVELGEQNQEHGLRVPSGGDGENTPVKVGDRWARRVSGDRSIYLYVAVDSAQLPPGDRTLWVTCDLLDEDTLIIGTQYDRAVAEPTLATRYSGGPSFLLLGGGGWVRQTAQIEHARLGHGQNGDTDLRLCGKFTVARIEVSDQPPAGWKPGPPYPPEALARLATRIGPGQDLTFGNDADASQAALYRALGVTSVESYLTWRTVENAGRGQWDWSHWDAQLAVLKAAGLKWTPFVVAGPTYATPDWFRKGPQHLPYVCCDHHQASEVESLWNPALKPELERFLQAFGDHYRDSGLLQHVLLGVTGIYGESIYPAGPEGGWTADFSGKYHNHGGWWAGDKYALASFRQRLATRYTSIHRLNEAWGTHHASFDEVVTFTPEQAPNAVAREDFVRWYEESMTEWTRWWCATARRALPQTPLLLCTGGDGAPFLGADFTAQAKAIAPYSVGIRITNEGSHYPANYSITREVATATRFYGTFCGFEPASGVDPEGVVARVYNATASGARELHFYSNNVVGSPAAVRSFRRVASQLQRRQPAVPRVAVYLPRAVWAQDAGEVGRTYEIIRGLREVVAFDLVSHTSVLDGILKGTKALIVPTPAQVEPDVRPVIHAWIRSGGILLRVFSPGPRDALAPAGGPPLAHGRVLVGADGDGGFLTGDWHGPENGAMFATKGARMRWSGARPGLVLPLPTTGAVTLELECRVPGAALAGVSGRILLDDEPLGQLDSKTGLYRLTVPAGRIKGPLSRLTFEVAGWQPSVVEKTGDTRVLGIAMTRVDWFTDEAAPVKPNTGLALRLDVAKLPITHSGQGVEVVVPRPAGGNDAATWTTLLGSFAAECGAGDLLDDDAADGVFATRLDKGRLWLNMTEHPVAKAGITIEPFGIGWSER